MRRVIEIVVEVIIDAVTFALGITFLFFLLKNSEELRSQANDTISSKINVTDNQTVYEKEPFQDTCSMASVLYEIKDTNLNVQIYIGNTEITTEMRKKFQNLNDSSEIRAHLNVGSTYRKEYVVNTDGEVVKIVYQKY